MKKIKLWLPIIVLMISFMPTNQSLAVTSSVDSTIVDQTGTVYKIVLVNGNKVRRPYTSAGAFLSYSFNSWEKVIKANSEDLALPKGEFIPPRDGTIFCSDRGTDKGTCYLISSGQKAGFTQESVFKAKGFTFRWALYGDASFLPSAPVIDNPNSPHRPGTLINIDGTVYLVTGTGLVGIPSMSALSSWGYWSDDVLPANNADRALAKAGTLPTREAGKLAPNNNQLAVDEVLRITSDQMPKGTEGENYSFQFKASGGFAPYNWEITQTTHPCCYVGIMPNTGVFSNDGTNMTPLAGDWAFTIKVRDAQNQTASKTFYWTVQSANLKITTTSMPNGVVGQNYNTTFAASGGTAPYTWNIASTTHPCCYVAIFPKTGAFSNLANHITPLAGTWNFEIQVTDAKGLKAKKNYTWLVKTENDQR